MSDGCTMWPDGLPVWLGGSGNEWLHCCEAHDLAYETTVTLQTHVELGQCVAQTPGGLAIGFVMTIATATWWLLRRHRKEL